MQIHGPSWPVWLRFSQIMLVETVYLMIIGSLTFTVLQRFRRGPVRLTCLLLLLACGVLAPYLMISQLHISHYVQRMTLSVFSVLSMFKSLEVIAGTTLPGVLDSRGNWLVSTLVYQHFSWCIILQTGNVISCMANLLHSCSLQVYYCSIVEPRYENGKALQPQPGQAPKLLRMVLGKREYLFMPCIIHLPQIVCSLQVLIGNSPKLSCMHAFCSSRHFCK
jgi:hypothetical protein